MKKPRKRTTLKEETGRFLFDMTKLIFGSIVFGSILRSEVPHDMLLKYGIGAASVTFILGLIFVIKEIKTDKLPPQRGGEAKHSPANTPSLTSW
jgi:hypothetical protein